MTERIGTCTSCGTRYGNIPPTLKATKVRCRKCGGVVEIPPLPAGLPAAGTAAAPPKLLVRPATLPPPATAGGRPVVPSASPPRSSPPQPVAGAPAAATAVGAMAKEGQPARSRAAEILAAARARRAAETGPAPPAPVRPAAAAPAVAHGVTARADAREGRVHHERHHAPAGTGPGRTPLILGLASALVIAIAAGSMWYLGKVRDQKAAQEAAAEAKAAEEQKAQEAAAEAAAAEASLAAAAAPAPAGGEAAGAAPETAAAPAAPGAAETAAVTTWEPPEPGGPVASQGIEDPDVLDLRRVPPLGRWSQTSDERWQQIQEDTALFLEDSGAQSDRAGRRLVEAGRDAFPAIVTAMLPLDYRDKRQSRLAAALNNLLYEMGGRKFNFGWKSTDFLDPSTEEFTKAVMYNKKVAVQWYNSWVLKFAADDAQWEGFLKGAAGQKEKAAEAKQEQAKPAARNVDDLIDG